jgi:hypothetical protein
MELTKRGSQPSLPFIRKLAKKGLKIPKFENADWMRPHVLSSTGAKFLALLNRLPVIRLNYLFLRKFPGSFNEMTIYSYLSWLSKENFEGIFKKTLDNDIPVMYIAACTYTLLLISSLIYSHDLLHAQ